MPAFHPLRTIGETATFAAMWLKKKAHQTPAIEPEPGEIAEAAKNPGGWVYRISGNYGPDDAVPPEAIVGAWKVADDGTIIGEFMRNPNFNPSSEAAHKP